MKWVPYVLGGVILAFAFYLKAHADGLTPRFPSPSGRLQVAFEPPRMPNPPVPYPSGGKSSARSYSVSFFAAGTSTRLAVTDFVDVLADSQSDPTPSFQLAAGVLWSPGEDFAVLPAEHWEHLSEDARKRLAPRRLRRQIVSLDSTSSWQTAVFPFNDEPLVWLDPKRLAGNGNEPCRKTVLVFDATTGKTQSLIDASSPEGFQILGKKDRHLLIETVLDACATPADQQRFKRRCINVDLSFLRQEPGVCP